MSGVLGGLASAGLRDIARSSSEFGLLCTVHIDTSEISGADNGTGSLYMANLRSVPFCRLIFTYPKPAQ